MSITDLLSDEVLQQAVRHELDVVGHEVAVHAQQAHGQRVREELLLDEHRVAHDLQHQLLAGLLHQVLEHQAREVRVQALPQQCDYH